MVYLVCATLLLAGCRPVSPDLAAVDLLMRAQEVEKALGRPTFWLSDGDFRWSWHEGGTVVGFARGSSKELRVVWVLQTEGSLQGSLKLGAPKAEAERLYGRASAIVGLAEPRIRLKGEQGATLDIVLANGKVSAFFLCLPGGRDPDVSLAGTGPGQLPTFELSHPGSIGIYPTSPGTTWVYEEDMTGDSIMGLAYETITDSRTEGSIQTVVCRREVPGWEDPTETTATIIGDLLFYRGRPVKPTRIYIGLEWSAGTDRYVAVRAEPLQVAAGKFQAVVVNFGGYAKYYVDGIGLVKRGGLELVEFHPGPE